MGRKLGVSRLEISRTISPGFINDTWPAGHATRFFFESRSERDELLFGAQYGRRDFHSLSITSYLRPADIEGNLWCASSSTSFIRATFESFAKFARRVGGQSAESEGFGFSQRFAAAKSGYYLSLFRQVGLRCNITVI